MEGDVLEFRGHGHCQIENQNLRVHNSETPPQSLVEWETSHPSGYPKKAHN